VAAGHLAACWLHARDLDATQARREGAAEPTTPEAT
jgi:hypothetical protein